MRVKEAVLSALTANRDAPISGAMLARTLNVSRNAVWKAVRALEEDGYRIDVGRNGYRLDDAVDKLSAPGILRHISHGAYRLTVEQEIDSTNIAAKRLAAAGAPEWTAVVSESQSAGRGRLGRSFYSPEGAGAYLSILVRPKLVIADALHLTTAAAVAVCRAIESVAGRRAGIKWVNDVFVDGRKVSGILTEASTVLEGGGLEYAVIGIGLNAVTPEGGYPAPIQDIAGSIFGARAPDADARCRLVAAVLQEFYALYPGIGAHAHLPEYRTRSLVIGRTLDVVRGAGTRRATALMIEEDGALRVRYEDGTEEALTTGEVSVRL